MVAHLRPLVEPTSESHGTVVQVVNVRRQLLCGAVNIARRERLWVLCHGLIVGGALTPTLGLLMSLLVVEFTVEPFVEGQPGPHVTQAVAAVEHHGVAVDFGPFGSTFTIDESAMPTVIGDMMRAAYANGATFVSVSVARTQDA